MIDESHKLLELYPAISDLQLRARSRIPFLAWEYLESGTGDEYALERNLRAFKDIQIRPQIMRGEMSPNLEVEMLGVKYSAPFGIAPVGLTGLMWPGAEFLLAQCAARNKIPYCLSTVATQTPEDVGQHVEDMGWFQLYPPREEEIRRDLLLRAESSGFHTLVVTADVPIPSRRERTKRAGLRMPPKTTVKIVMDAIANPAWTRATLKYGSPRLKTIEKYTQSKSRADAAQYVNDNLGGTLSWSYLEELRKEWNGSLILKGVLAAEDAQRAVDAGVDAIVVSNHGGRQFDACPPAIDTLNSIATQVKGKTVIIYDSGIRSGMDIIKAMALGADFVLLGRAFIYGLAALGSNGGDHVYNILIDEMRNNMLQLACRNIGDIKELKVI